MDEIFSFVGNTSLVELKNIQKKYQLKSKIFAKLELMNPTGSIKDRPAFKMVNDAINKGILKDYNSFNYSFKNNTLTLNQNMITPYQDMHSNEYAYLIQKTS